MSHKSTSSSIETTRPRRLTWRPQSSASSTVNATRGSRHGGLGLTPRENIALLVLRRPAHRVEPDELQSVLEREIGSSRARSSRPAQLAQKYQKGESELQPSPMPQDIAHGSEVPLQAESEKHHCDDGSDAPGSQDALARSALVRGALRWAGIVHGSASCQSPTAPTGATSPSVASSARGPGDEDRAETALPPGARA